MEGVFGFAVKTALLGLITGFAIGLVSKKISKLLVFAIAVIVILFQLSIFNGIFQIEWLTLVEKIPVDELRKQIEPDNLSHIIWANLPFTIFAVIGFILGIMKE